MGVFFYKNFKGTIDFGSKMYTRDNAVIKLQLKNGRLDGTEIDPYTKPDVVYNLYENNANS